MNKSELIKSFDECMKLQASFNAVVNPNWKKAGYNWRRAMWVESAELADHLGYKWWKNIDAEYDKKQALLEVVDIFHFMLSEVLIDGRNGDNLYHSYEWATRHVYAPNKEKKLQQIEEFVSICIDGGAIQAAFFQVMIALDVRVDDLIKFYLGKNALNKFRQDNGYKEGTYRKTWSFNGEEVEDNKVLEHVLSLDAPMTFDSIYNDLKAIYAAF